MLMATGDGAHGLGLNDDSLPLLDNFDDVIHMLNSADELDTAPNPPPAPVQREDQPSCGHGFSGNSLGNSYTGGEGTAGVAQPNDFPVGGDPSTSSSTAAADVLDCRGCQVLREVVHSNGLELTKLSIHGAAGGFNHATIDRCINSEGFAPAIAPRSHIDFRGRDYEWVKSFLTDYAQRRAAGNYAVVRDSLSLFHHVLCTPMNPCMQGNDGGHGHEGGTVHRPPAVDVAASATVQPEPAGPSTASNTTASQVQLQPFQPVIAAGRTALALQRERTRKMQFNDIAPYFTLPIVEAAEKLDICTTVLKGICRRVGVQRWPYRKVKKIDKEIIKIKRSGNGDWERNEIERLNAERNRIFLFP